MRFAEGRPRRGAYASTSSRQTPRSNAGAASPCPRSPCTVTACRRRAHVQATSGDPVDHWRCTSAGFRGAATFRLGNMEGIWTAQCLCGLRQFGPSRPRSPADRRRSRGAPVTRREIPWNYDDRPAVEWIRENWLKHRAELERIVGRTSHHVSTASDSSTGCR